ncbi:hypothetical protein ACTG9Q_15700 [Actinokineospora sp. 24-640]
MARSSPMSLMLPRWRGEPGRLEVWYATITDPVTGTGLWVHHELVAPVDGGPPRRHGWIALFPPGMPPEIERFQVTSPVASIGLNALDSVDGTSTLRLSGSTSGSGYSWHLEQTSRSAPLYTFPEWAWRHRLLPAAQIVPMPTATYNGYVLHPRGELVLENASGAMGRIYGRGNALRWAWLHADLGDGDVLEVVSAVSAHGPLRRLPALTLLRLRHRGRTWPSADSLLCAPAFRSVVDFPEWSVRGRIGRTRIRVDTTFVPEHTLVMDYTGPDGRRSTCRNSERASATVVVERRRSGRWEPAARWHLAERAHAEIGD